MASAPELAAYRDKVIFQRYGPTHFHVAGLGFKLDGRPAIHILAPDGTVLDRLDDYAGGAPALAASLSEAFGKIRKPDPNYDPTRPPRSPLFPSGTGPSSPALIILGGLATAGILATRKEVS